MAEYRLPDVGEGLTEAEIVNWHVAVGDVIAVNDVVVEIETAKSLVELPSPYAGTVQALLVDAGQTVAVGTPILRVTTADETTSPADEAEPESQSADEGPATLVGYGPRETTSRRRRPGAPAPASATTDNAWEIGHQATKSPLLDEAARANPSVQVALGSTRPLAKPPVRMLARERGVDLNTVDHAGPVITRADVEAAAAGRATPAAVAVELPPLGDREWREPVKGVRKAMAQAMVTSAFTAPHVTEWVEVDATHTMEYVATLRADPAYEGTRVTPLLIVARACVQALRHAPELNARWDGEAVTFRRYVNLGIAAATPRGLLVPNVKDAGDLSGPELARALEQLTATAREGKTQPAEQAGGTFTITNVGVFNVDGGTPIINPGESAILAVGAIRKKPWVVTLEDGSDAIAIRHVVTLALSFDHRIVDGEKGSRFLAQIAAAAEDPASVLHW